MALLTQHKDTFHAEKGAILDVSLATARWVTVDETYVGGPEEGKRGRKTEAKAIVAGATEKSGRGIGRIRLRRLKDASADSPLPFV